MLKLTPNSSHHHSDIQASPKTTGASVATIAGVAQTIAQTCLAATLPSEDLYPNGSVRQLGSAENRQAHERHFTFDPESCRAHLENSSPPNEPFSTTLPEIIEENLLEADLLPSARDTAPDVPKAGTPDVKPNLFIHPEAPSSKTLFKHAKEHERQANLLVANGTNPDYAGTPVYQDLSPPPEQQEA